MQAQQISRRRRVVIAEDDAHLLGVLAEVLAEEGYLAFPVTSAADAERLIRAVHPDVVILDLHLAGDAYGRAGGWHVLDRLILDPQSRDIPVVLTTGARTIVEARGPRCCRGTVFGCC